VDSLLRYCTRRRRLREGCPSACPQLAVCCSTV
jgi:hypothetical protein